MRRKYVHFCRYILLALFMVAPAFIAYAQEVKVSAAFDSTDIKIGDQVTLHLKVEQPINSMVVLPFLHDTLTGKIEVLKVMPADSVRKDGILQINQDVLVTSFDSGYHQVPPIAFPYVSGSVKDTLYSQALALNVTTLPVDSLKDVLDIKPPYKPPFSILDYWPFIVGFIALVIIVVVVVLLITRKKKGYLFMPPKPVEPAHVTALRQLDTLRGEKLWQNNKTKEYYTRLTEIIREYIEKRFGINALEMTSEEIIIGLRKINFDNEGNIGLLNKMFSTSDLVKFAKAQPLPDENEVNLLDAYQFVNNTQPATTSTLDNGQEEPVKKS